MRRGVAVAHEELEARGPLEGAAVRQVRLEQVPEGELAVPARRRVDPGRGVAAWVSLCQRLESAEVAVGHDVGGVGLPVPPRGELLGGLKELFVIVREAVARRRYGVPVVIAAVVASRLDLAFEAFFDCAVEDGLNLLQFQRFQCHWLRLVKEFRRYREGVCHGDGHLLEE